MLSKRIGILLTAALLVAGCAGGVDHSKTVGPTTFGLVWAGNGPETGGLYEVHSGHIATKIVNDAGGILRTYALSTTGKVAYKVSLNQTETIYIADSSGTTTNQAAFAADAFVQGGLAFSPDEQFLAEATTENGFTDIYVMPTTGTMTRVKVTTIQNVDPSSTIGWSSDGFIYFVAGTDNSKFVFRIDPLNPGIPDQMTGSNGKMVNLSPDYTKFSMVTLDGQSVVTREINTGTEETITTLTDPSSTIDGASWADNHTIILVRLDTSFNYHIQVVDTVTHAVTEYNPSYYFGSVATFGNGGINNVD